MLNVWARGRGALPAMSGLEGGVAIPSMSGLEGWVFYLLCLC